MSLQPIDLQTLFVRLSQIGREQSAIRDAVAQNQAVAGSEIVQRAQQETHTVRQPDEVSEGPESVQEDEEEQRRREEERSSDGEKEKQDGSGDAQVFDDPALGQNVDLSG